MSFWGPPESDFIIKHCLRKQCLIMDPGTDFGSFWGAPQNRVLGPNPGYTVSIEEYRVLGPFWAIFEQIWPNMANYRPN